MIISRLTLCAFVALLPLGAAARNLGQYQSSPDIEAWVQSLTDKRGQGCCATADGYPAEAVWDTDRQGYRVKIGQQWHAVPESAVITQPNRLGRAVVWYLDMDGEIFIRCFLPGAGV